MDNKNYISSFCSINNGKVSINGILDFSNTENSNNLDFLKTIYKHYNINYPKFYKMDGLCKLAFLTSELLIKSSQLTQKHQSNDIAIITANSSSSLEIDTEHQLTINDKSNYFPSPANFVYTLPNILIGEIAIRNKIKGENSFFIFDKFDTLFINDYINSLLNTNKASACIVGWIDFYENNYQSFLYSVEKQANGIKLEHTLENINKLITNN